MPIYRFEGPDGKIHRVEAASPEEAQRGMTQWSQSAPKTPDYTRARAVADGNVNAQPRMKVAAQQGLTAGFYDDVAAGAEAGYTGLKNLALEAMGKPKPFGMKDAYQATLDSYEAQQKQLGQEHPVAQAGAGLMGAGMIPGVGGFIGRAANIPGAMMRSGAVGAAYGGAAGAGNARGDLGERAAAVVPGAAMGGLFGAAAPPAFAGLARASAPILNRVAATPQAQQLAARTAAFLGRPAPTPPAPAPPTADLRVARAIQNAAQRDSQDAVAIAARARSNPNAPAFQAGGENMTTLAELSAQSPGMGRQIVTQAVRDHQAGATDRVKSEIGSAMGGKNNYFETLEKMTAERSQKAGEGMRNIADHLVTLDENSVTALRSDLADGAIKEAALHALASADPEVRASGAALNRLSEQLLDKPSAITIPVRSAQDISRALLTAADASYKSGNGARGTALKGLGKAVRENARTPEKGGFKEYDDWLKAYGDDTEHMQALELGRNVFNGGLDNTAEKVGMELGDMSAASRDHYSKGVAEAVLFQARSKGGVPAMRQLLKSEEFGDKVKLAFKGDDAGFKRFMDAMESEIQAQGRNNQVVGNSRTYGREAAARDLEAQGGLDPFDAAGAVLDTVVSPGASAARGARAALKSLPRKDRSILGDPETSALLARGITNPDEMTRLLNQLQAQRAQEALRSLSARKGAGMVTLPAATLGTRR